MARLRLLALVKTRYLPAGKKTPIGLTAEVRGARVMGGAISEREVLLAGMALELGVLAGVEIGA